MTPGKLKLWQSTWCVPSKRRLLHHWQITDLLSTSLRGFLRVSNGLMIVSNLIVDRLLTYMYAFVSVSDYVIMYNCASSYLSMCRFVTILTGWLWLIKQDVKLRFWSHTRWPFAKQFYVFGQHDGATARVREFWLPSAFDLLFWKQTTSFYSFERTCPLADTKSIGRYCEPL